MAERAPNDQRRASGSKGPSADKWPTRPVVREHDADAALNENVQEIKEWEQATLDARSRAEHVSDWVAATAASGPVMVAHLIGFGSWVVINLGWVPRLAAFDPFPFPFLTVLVSLEAIFLALFVLASQNRLARQSDRRSHLNLQIDLLAEREMTAVLQMLRDLTSHFSVETSVTAEQLRDLARKTNIHQLASRMAEFDVDQAVGQERSFERKR